MIMTKCSGFGINGSGVAVGVGLMGVAAAVAGNAVGVMLDVFPQAWTKSKGNTNTNKIRICMAAYLP
jgi:hypothetical protein